MGTRFFHGIYENFIIIFYFCYLTRIKCTFVFYQNILFNSQILYVWCIPCERVKRVNSSSDCLLNSSRKLSRAVMLSSVSSKHKSMLSSLLLLLSFFVLFCFGLLCVPLDVDGCGSDVAPASISSAERLFSGGTFSFFLLVF